MGYCSQLCCRDKYSCTHVSRFLGRIWSSLFKVGCRYHFPLSENCKYHIICCLKTLIARYGHFDIWSHRWQSLRDNSIKQLNDTINVKQKNHFWLGPFYPSSSDSNAFLLYLESIIKTFKREVQGNFSMTGWLAGWVTRISAQSF